MMTVECAGCMRPILDRFLLHFLDKTWHSSCVKCQICRKLLDEKCFYKEGNIYCREDFYRCFGPKCSGCGEGILPQDYVRKARDKVYHLQCFSCSMCAKQLSTGEVLYLGPGDDALLCKEDYLKTNQDSLFSDEEEDGDERVPIPGLEGGMPHHMNHHGGIPRPGGMIMPPNDPGLLPPGLTPTHPNSKMETNNNNNVDKDMHHAHHPMGSGPGEMLKSDHDNDSLDGDDHCKGEDSENKSPDADGAGGKRRGPRTTIKAKQLEVLKTAFSQTPKPTRHIREQLAKETGLSMRVIQVWFQNKRSKERRMKQMTNGMVAARGFFPGKGGRRGFPLIGDEFGYFPHDKPYHDFGYPNFPHPDGFFPGPMGFMGPPGGGPNMDQPLPMGPMGGPPGGPPPMGPGPPMPPVSGSNGVPPPPGTPGSTDGFPPTSMGGGGSGGDNFSLGSNGSGSGSGSGSGGNGEVSQSRPSPGEDFTPNSSSSSNGPGFSSTPDQQQQQQNEQMVW